MPTETYTGHAQCDLLDNFFPSHKCLALMFAIVNLKERLHGYTDPLGVSIDLYVVIDK